MDRVASTVRIAEVRAVRTVPHSPNGLRGQPVGQRAGADAFNHRSEPAVLTNLVGVSLQEELRPDVGRRRLGDRRYVLFAVLAVAVFQTVWIATVPPFRASDEFDHAFRAAAVANGQWHATQLPRDGRGLLVDADADLVAAARAQCEAMGYTGPDNCRGVASTTPGRVQVGSGAARYHPAFYWAVGTAARPFHGAGALYAMRVATAILCLVLLATALWATSVAGGSWRRVGAVIALSPVAVFSMSMAAPNGLEMAAALALWSTLLSLSLGAPREVRTQLLVAASAAAVVLSTVRMLGPLFVLLIVVTVVAFRPAGVLALVKDRGKAVLYACAAVAAAVAASAGWILYAGGAQDPSSKQGDSDLTPLHPLVLWPLQSIAAFPYRDQPGPAAVYPVMLLLFLVTLGWAVRVGVAREKAILVAASGLAILLPVLLTVATMSGRGVMWQGRYGLPYSMGLLLMASAIWDRDRREGGAGRAPGAVVRCLLATVVAACTVACAAKVRVDELARTASAQDTSWHPPSPILLGLMGVAGAALLVHAWRPQGGRRTGADVVDAGSGQVVAHGRG
jgi:predicted membrane protein DUF2142